MKELSATIMDHASVQEFSALQVKIVLMEVVLQKKLVMTYIVETDTNASMLNAIK